MRPLIRGIPGGRIRLGDVITAVDGRKIDSIGTLLDELEKHKVGDTVQITLIRDRKEMNIPVRLGPAS
ncbi:MAG: PDZ domain-containing protein [Pseudomonadota bacterium]